MTLMEEIVYQKRELARHLLARRMTELAHTLAVTYLALVLGLLCLLAGLVCASFGAYKRDFSTVIVGFQLVNGGVCIIAVLTFLALTSKLRQDMTNAKMAVKKMTEGEKI